MVRVTVTRCFRHDAVKAWRLEDGKGSSIKRPLTFEKFEAAFPAKLKLHSLHSITTTLERDSAPEVS